MRLKIVGSRGCGRGANEGFARYVTVSDRSRKYCIFSVLRYSERKTAMNYCRNCVGQCAIPNSGDLRSHRQLRSRARGKNGCHCSPAKEAPARHCQRSHREYHSTRTSPDHCQYRPQPLIRRDQCAVVHITTPMPHPCLRPWVICRGRGCWNRRSGHRYPYQHRGRYAVVTIGRANSDKYTLDRVKN